MTKKEKKPGRKPGKKFWLILTAAVLVLAVAAFFIIRPLLKSDTAAAQTTATVTRGSIVRTIEGSGVIAANDQYTVSSLVTGEVLADHFEEGDSVEEGDLLYEIDSSDLDYNLEKAESSISTARISYEESLETLDNMTVTAPISGVITSLSVKEGDEITSGKQVAEIINSDRMLLTLNFLTSDAQNIYPGSVASVVAESAPRQTLSGTVKSVATGSMANSLGVAVTSVEILVDNPGGLQNGGRATATVGTYACNEAGTLAYEDTETVTVKAGGTVTGLTLKAGDRVSAGTVLFSLTSDSTSRSIERSRISYNDAVSSYNNTYDQLDDYRITAPISGKVIQKSVKAGDKLESGSGSNASSMAIIADLSILTFEMSVDELDIAEIEEGQEVQVTADAVAGKMFTGYVDNVSIVGTSSNGVTTYPVKVVLNGEENADLIPGMNVSATIIIEQKEDILLIPASAISRGNLVAVKGTAPESTASPEKTAEATAAPTEAPTEVPADAAPAADERPMPSGVEPGQMPEGMTPGQMPEGAERGQRPEGGREGQPESDAAEAPAETEKPGSSGGPTEVESESERMNNKAADITMQTEAPEGFYYVRIETGITDGTYIEVLSGLSEGDVILLPNSAGDASASVTFTRDAEASAMGGMMGGGMGGMGGGMPGGMSGGGGGMPGGMRR